MCAIRGQQWLCKITFEQNWTGKETECLALACMPACKGLDLEWEGDSLWEQTLPWWGWEEESRPKDPEPSKDTLHTFQWLWQVWAMWKNTLFTGEKIWACIGYFNSFVLPSCRSSSGPYSLLEMSSTKFGALNSFTLLVLKKNQFVANLKWPFIVLGYVHMGNITTKFQEAQLPSIRH